MSELWQLGALQLAERIASGDVVDRFTDLRCLGVADQIQNIVGPPEPIDPVTA